MQILSHRGYWKTPAEQNSATALARSFHLGFGTETDLRDRDGRLVISHDPAGAASMPAEMLFEIHRGIDDSLPLALNLKSTGLQKLLRTMLDQFSVRDYFLFDMAVPDTIACIKAGLKVFTRQSEYEREPMFYAASTGVWFDGFETDWAENSTLSRHLDAGKRVCIVSPELHGRDPRAFWDRLSAMPSVRSPELMLCTDLPEAARGHFS